jgi:hypothetical protein
MENEMIKSVGNRKFLGGLLVAALMCSASLSATARDVDKKDYNSDQVSVTWNDPAQFSELHYGFQFQQPKPEVWLTEFQKTLVKRADHVLKPGQHLSITITDVKLAGRVEPFHGAGASDIRVVKSIYPPEIELSFSLTGSDGQVLDSGERKLRDIAFLDRGSVNRSEAYRFEKRMLKEWVDKEFGRKSAG